MEFHKSEEEFSGHVRSSFVTLCKLGFNDYSVRLKIEISKQLSVECPPCQIPKSVKRLKS
jgi:hypothetical protein